MMRLVQNAQQQYYRRSEVDRDHMFEVHLKKHELKC